MSAEALTKIETNGTGAPLARLRGLMPMIAAAAPEVETGRRLNSEVVDALHQACLFRLLMPRWLDGFEADPATFVEIIEMVARGDASTAWCLCQMSVCSMSSVYLGREIAREIFEKPGGALAWGSSSDCKAVRVPGGYRVSGTWEFGSGCHHATWLGGHCPVVDADGTPINGGDAQPLLRSVLFPKSAAAITDVWRVIGLRGTGSDRYVLDDLFIPEEHTITALMRWPDEPRNALGGIYRFAGGTLYAAGFGGVGLGNARGMLDQFLDLAQRKVPRWGRNPLADNSIVQVAVAQADTRLEAARVYLLHTLTEAYEAAEREGRLPMDHRIKIRASGTFAIREATSVVNHLYELAGTTAIFEGNPFERRFRDAHTVSQHFQGRIGHFETVGKYLLGIDTDAPFV